MVLHSRCRQTKATAGTNGFGSSNSRYLRGLADMNLNDIAKIVATFITDLIMQIPVVIGSRNILNVKRLIGSVLRLADFPFTRTIAAKARCRHIQVFAIANHERSLQRPRDLGCNIHH